MKHIQKIIEDRLEEILDILRRELGQARQEPDFVLLAELREFLK